MDSVQRKRLDAALASLDDHIKLVSSCGLSETEFLLKVARLDIKMRLHNISSSELAAFCREVERAYGVDGAPTSSVIDAGPRFRARSRKKA